MGKFPTNSFKFASSFNRGSRILNVLYIHCIKKTSWFYQIKYSNEVQRIIRRIRWVSLPDKVGDCWHKYMMVAVVLAMRNLIFISSYTEFRNCTLRFTTKNVVVLRRRPLWLALTYYMYLFKVKFRFYSFLETCRSLEFQKRRFSSRR